MKKSNVKILAIESSCDETAAAVVEDGRKVLSNVISSQIDLHTIYGGVVPEIASRKHIENINFVIKDALKEANVTFEDIDAIAVTYGPGLVGALLVGVGEAKALAYGLNKPLIGVHHIKGHVLANLIEHKELKPPFVCLIVSGGHTEIAIVKDYNDFEIVATTRDSVGLGYPGGPKIDKAAKLGNPHAIEFPKARVNDSKYDFSFSGVKSAVLNYQNKANMTGEKINVNDLVASFQRAVVGVLVEHTVEVAKDYNIKNVAMAGGVASNTALRSLMEEKCSEEGLKLHFPSPIYCTDNAAMIGVAAYFEYLNENFKDLTLNAVPNLEL